MKQASLRIQLLFSSSLIIFGILAISTFINIQNVRRSYLEMIVGSSEGLSYVIANELLEGYAIAGSVDDTMLSTMSLRCVKLYERGKQQNLLHISAVNADGLIVAHNDKALWNVPVDDPKLLAAIKRQIKVAVPVGDMYHALIPIMAEDGAYLATVDIGYPRYIVDDRVRQLLLRSGVLLAAFIISTCFLLWWVLYSLLTKPIRSLTAMGQTIARGELEQAVLSVKQVAGNLDEFRHSKNEIRILTHVFYDMVRQLKDIIANVKLTADSTAQSSDALDTRAEALSEGASQQASAAQQVSSSMEQMAANIRQNAENARKTEQIALQSASQAEEGGKVVAETVMAMKQIVQKIRIIEDIASQTRLLSLNATIEAARAQEHGKAFAVVASEVRQLAAMTKTAAEEINELATSSLAVSERAGQMLSTLVPSIHQTAKLVQEISAASNEQSIGTEQVNKAVQQLDQVAQQTAVLSRQIASTAEGLTRQAELLQQMMQFFQIEERRRIQ